MPELVPGDAILTSLGTEAEDLFNSDAAPPSKKEEDEILTKAMDEYEVEKIKDTMDKQGTVPESVYFCYGEDSELFNNALEFLSLSPINREFAAFLMSDLGFKTMTQNKLSIHVDSGDIFTIIITQMKTFTVFCYHGKTMKQLMFRKNGLTAIALNNIFLVIYSSFLLKIKKSLIYCLLKTQNICFIDLTISLNHTEIQDINCYIQKNC